MSPSSARFRRQLNHCQDLASAGTRLPLGWRKGRVHWLRENGCFPWAEENEFRTAGASKFNPALQLNPDETAYPHI